MMMSGKRLHSAHWVTGLLVLAGGFARQRAALCRLPPRCVPYLVSTMLLLGSVVSVKSPFPAWAAVYECRDVTGKTVLTDRPRGLRNCKMLSQGTAPALTPPDMSPMPQVSPPSISPNRSSPPPYVPLPPTPPTDTQGTSTGSLPAPNPKASSSPPPSPPAPCARGLNPLNPLSTLPCVQSDQTGTQPAGVAPAPSP